MLPYTHSVRSCRTQVNASSIQACARTVALIDIALAVGRRDYPLYADHFDMRKGKVQVHFGDFALWTGITNVERFVAQLGCDVLNKSADLEHAKRDGKTKDICRRAENWSSAASCDSRSAPFMDVSGMALRLQTAFLELAMGTRQRTSFPPEYLKTRQYQGTAFTTVTLIVTEPDVSQEAESSSPDVPANLPASVPMVPLEVLVANAP